MTCHADLVGQRLLCHAALLADCGEAVCEVHVMTVVSTTRGVHIRGPLAGYVEGFELELTRLGFTSASVVNQSRLVAHLSRWLEAQGLGVEDLTAEWVEAFIGERRAAYTGLFSRRALRPLLGWLATSG